MMPCFQISTALIFNVINIFFPTVLYLMAEEEQKFAVRNTRYLKSPILTKLGARSKMECSARCFELKQCCFASYTNASDGCQLSEHAACDTVIQTGTGSSLMEKEVVCDSGWRKFNCHCYYFEFGKVKTWPEAKKDCQRLGAHFVKIENSCENNWITSVVKKENPGWGIWIGGNDLEKEGHMVWAVDGSEITYGDWYPGEPNNNAHRNEDCVNMLQKFNYKWNDEPCSVSLKYICEK